MLKLLLISVLAVSSLATPSTSPTVPNDMEYQLGFLKDINDILNTIPVPKIYQTLIRHLFTDMELQSAIMHVLGKDFQRHFRALLSKPAVKEYLMRYDIVGINIGAMQEMVNEFVSLLAFDRKEEAHASFGPLLRDVWSLIPYDELLEVLDDKLRNSPSFVRFWNSISDPTAHALTEKIMKSKEWKYIAQDLEDLDVPVYKFIAEMYALFGWSNPKASPNEL